MAATAQFAATIRCAEASISAANTGRGGDGTLVTVFSAGASSGSRVDRAYIVATSSTTAGMIRLFCNDSGTSTGSNRLLYEVPVAAVTPSGSVPSWSSGPVNFDGGYLLPVGYSIKVSTQNAETFVVHMIGGDF